MAISGLRAYKDYQKYGWWRFWCSGILCFECLEWFWSFNDQFQRIIA